jgi:antitoxin component of MazEF toxin-antitoxin module
MKIQKVKAYKLDKNRWQFKYVITLPEATLQELSWPEGSELKATVEGQSLVLTIDTTPPKKPRRVITTKLTYQEFRDKVRQTIQYSDNGMTWTQIREKLKLDQVVPNNKWVRQMEKDIGLMRVKRSDGVIVWRVNHVR